jgi:hypothetical protein
MGTFYDTILKPASEAIGYRRADPPPKPKAAPVSNCDRAPSSYFEAPLTRPLAGVTPV